MLVAKGQPAHLHIEVRDYDGTLVAATGTVNVTVKDIDEVTVATGTATASQHGHDAGIYTYNLTTAVTNNLGIYEATVTYTVSGSNYTRTYEIVTVGEHLFEIHELRARDSRITAAAYPADYIRTARDSVTDALETAAKVAFSTKPARATLSGDGTTTLLLPHVEVTAINGCTVYVEDAGADTADEITGDELIDIEVNRETGLITRTDGQVFPVGSNNVIVDYEHGYERVPGPVRDAAMTLVIEAIVPSQMPARATAQSTDVADFRISVANVELGRDTGIPAVDAVIAQYGRKRPGLG